MTKYLIHVQLQNADKQALLDLDKEMKNASFVLNNNSLATNLGVIQRSGEYSISSKKAMEDISVAIANAVGKTGYKFKFTIMKEKIAYVV